MEVAELVPEIAGARAQRGTSASSSSGAGRRLEQPEMRGRRGSCQPVSRPSIARRPRSGVDDEARPALPCRHRCRRRRRPSRARVPPSCRPRSRGRPSRGRLRRAVQSRPGRGSARGTAARRALATRRRCAADGAIRMPRRDEFGHELGGERPAGARHLRAAGLAARRPSGRRRAATARGRSRSGSAGRVGRR